MTKKQKRILWRVIASAVLLGGALAVCATFPEMPLLLRLGVFLPAYLWVGADVLLAALRNVFHGRVFDEEFLMAIATVGAFAIGEYPEAVFVMLFFRVGELFEGLATRRARGALTSLSALVPDTARVLAEDGSVTEEDAEAVAVGTLIRVLSGDRVPLDAVVTEGRASLDLSALTGESLPSDAEEGSELPAGAVCLDGMLTLRTVRPMEESTAARILEMVENATDRKARAESFITRFARVYTPVVCALAVLVACLLPLFGMPWQQSVYAALSFLVISCPCALVISVPLTFFAGVGCGAKHGILFKGSRELERLAAVRAAAFDKTGTLTHGDFRPTAILPSEGVTEDGLLSLCAALESASTHPIARSVVAAYRARFAEEVLPTPTQVLETAGGGICGVLDGARICVGNAAYLAAHGASVPTLDTEDCVLYVARDGGYLGAVLVSDRVRADSASALLALRAAGLSPLMLLSGDRRAVAERVGASLGIDEIHAPCSPEDKSRILARAHTETGKRMLFVGDGINDAPALASADCGMAMGALGTDAAQLAADVVLLTDGLSGAARAVRIARKSVRIVRANIVFILAVKAAVMLLSAFSLVGMWAAVFADVGVSVISILNAKRASRVKD